MTASTTKPLASTWLRLESMTGRALGLPPEVLELMRKSYYMGAKAALAPVAEAIVMITKEENIGPALEAVQHTLEEALAFEKEIHEKAAEARARMGL